MSSHRWIVGIGAAVIVSMRAAAQVTAEFGVSAALYHPVGTFTQGFSYTNLPETPGDLASSAISSQFRLWLNPRLGFQLDATVGAWQQFGGQCNLPTVGFGASGCAPITNARVQSATAQALFVITEDPDRSRVWAGIGAGLVQHAGSSYAPLGSPTDLAAVVGLGATARIATHLNGQVAINTMFYRLQARDPSNGMIMQVGTQIDPVLSTGVSWELY